VADEYGYDEQDDQYEQQEKPSGLRRKLAEATQRAADRDALAAEVTALKQQMAVRDAGLDLNDTQRKALLSVHSGDLTPDQLKQTAQNLGFVQAPPPPVPVPDDPSLAVHAQIAADAAGAAPLQPDREAEIDARLNSASTEEEFMAIYRESGRPLAP